jgi:hypothetical protein
MIRFVVMITIEESKGKQYLDIFGERWMMKRYATGQ